MALGFIRWGIVAARPPIYFDAFREWLAQGHHGGMKWLERHVDIRKDPASLLPGCRAIVCLAYPYPAERPRTEDGFTTARYAQPQEVDYHRRLRGLANQLALEITRCYPDARCRVCVDSAPIMERSFAWAAGVGFWGKNNMLIIPGVGSYFFLAEILTTAPLKMAPVEPMAPSCGSCTQCLDACPTGALEGPYRLNAGKCLSYLTIEHRDPLPQGLGRWMGDCFFGCDACQEACPQNPAPGARHTCLPPLETFLRMNASDFKAAYGDTALGRAGIAKIQENIHALGRH